jgi:uncharacterized protein (TIGR00369 family)
MTSELINRSSDAGSASDLLARLREELENPPFHEFLRPVAVHADHESIVVGLPYREEFCGRRGSTFFHGGVIASLIDIAAHAAVAVRIGQMAPTIDLRIDYLRSADTAQLLATARVLKLGRNVSCADVEVKGDDGKLVALGRGTFSSK